MDMWFGQDQQMDQRPAATLVAFASLLALPSWRLEQAMYEELAQNPALEVQELDVCPRCGNPRNDGVCYFCLEKDRTDPEDAFRQNESGRPTEEDFDLFSVVAAPRTLAEELTELAHAVFAKDDHFIAEFLIGSLDDSGLLTVQVGDVVKTLGVQSARVKEVLATLQKLAPPGVGARDAQECLMLQLERLESGGGTVPALARPILEAHLKDLAQGRYVEIGQTLGATSEAVIAARDFIREKLRPFPIVNPAESDGAQVVDTAYATPDVVIRKGQNAEPEFVVEVIESRQFALRISPMYRDLAQSIRHGQQNVSDDERHHVLEHIARAQQFIGHLQERRSTLERVVKIAAEHQAEYLRHGVRSLQPLTRLQVAEELSLHVSTVSRAVSDKYVLLPWQQVKPLRVFFEAVSSIHDVLRELISDEEHPLTDVEIADQLSAQGYPVARRTVAKYRKQLGILPSTLR